MLIGASSARVSLPFQRQVLWVARSISGLTAPRERGSWKISSPPTSIAAPSEAPQTASPAMVAMIRVRDMALFLVFPLDQAVIHADIAAEQPEAAVQKQQDQAAHADDAGNQTQPDQSRDQHIAVARGEPRQQVNAGSAN